MENILEGLLLAAEPSVKSRVHLAIELIPGEASDNRFSVQGNG